MRRRRSSASPISRPMANSCSNSRIPASGSVLVMRDRCQVPCVRGPLVGGAGSARRLERGCRDPGMLPRTALRTTPERWRARPGQRRVPESAARTAPAPRPSPSTPATRPGPARPRVAGLLLAQKAQPHRCGGGVLQLADGGVDVTDGEIMLARAAGDLGRTFEQGRPSDAGHRLGVGHVIPQLQRTIVVGRARRPPRAPLEPRSPAAIAAANAGSSSPAANQCSATASATAHVSGGPGAGSSVSATARDRWSCCRSPGSRSS